MGDQEVVEFIVSRIKRFFRTPVNAHCDFDNPTSPHHILWLCGEIGKADPIKRSCWTGFLLGVMISHGLVDVEKERQIIEQLLA